MKICPTPAGAQKRRLSCEKSEPQGILLGLLFIIALAIRVFDIGEIPLGFHPVKQYRSALTARFYYYQGIDSISQWKKDVAHANLERLGFLVPPILDRTTALAYRILNGEHLWIPRLMSAIFWVCGGLFLYWIACLMLPARAALVSTAFYLLLPFRVIASQSFQPDPFMLMMTIVSLYAVLQFYQSSSTVSLLIASIAAAVAILIKPVSLFIIMGGFVALRIEKYGARATLLSRDSLIFALISLPPAILFYGYGISLGGVIRQQAAVSFVPNFLFHFDFWNGWLKRISIVMGPMYLFVGVLGTFLFRKRRSRAWPVYGRLRLDVSCI